MEGRRASCAFFSTFRAWSILCRPCRKQIHTTAYIRRRIKRDSVSHIPHISNGANISSRRWASSEFDGLADAVDRKNEASRPKGLADSGNEFSAASSFIRKVENNEELVLLPRNLLKKYPDLDLPGFINKLRLHKRMALDNSNKREKSGSATLKKLMRSMPHSTVLITTLSDDRDVHYDRSLKDAKNLSPFVGHFRGAIVSSMTSVTVGPPAIISFNFKEPSATLDGIRRNKFFTVHFLKSDQDGASLAMQFLSRPGDHHNAWKAVSKDHNLSVVKRLKLHEKRGNTSQTPAAPVVKGPGVVAHLICEIMPEKCVSNIGDHAIIVAKVTSSALYNSKNVEDNVSDRNVFPPLLMYSEGRFKEHGSPIKDTATEGLDLSDATIEKNAEGGVHPDLAIRRQVVTASDPLLYQAVDSYMDSVINKHKDSSHTPALKRIHATLATAPDRRARFVAALLFWRFEQAIDNKQSKGLQNKVELQKGLGLQMNEAGFGDITATVTHDKQLKEIAQELAKSAWRESMGSDAGWLDNVFRAMDAGSAMEDFREVEQKGQKTKSDLKSRNSALSSNAGSHNSSPRSRITESMTEEESSIFRRKYPNLSANAEVVASRTRSSERSETGRRRAQIKIESEKVDRIPEAEAIGNDVSIEQALLQARAQLKGMYPEPKKDEPQELELEEKTPGKESASG